jgi:hypothetical protein
MGAEGKGDEELMGGKFEERCANAIHDYRRNKFIGWAALVLAIQNWLGESQDTKKTSSQPAYFSVGMSCKFDLLLRILSAGGAWNWDMKNGFGKAEWQMEWRFEELAWNEAKKFQ